MTQSKKGKWRDRTIEKLNRAESPTVFQGQENIQKDVSPSDQPQFDVFQVRLKGKDDQPIIISGNTLNVELQVSLLKAVDQLLEIRGFGSGSSKAGIPFVSNKGKPKVILYFLEKDEDVEEGYQPIEARLSFRLNNVSEKWDTPDAANLSIADIERLAVRIKNVFFIPTPYKIKKGKTTVSYRDKVNGIESYSYFYNKQDGIEFYKKMCTVAEVEYQAKYCKATESQDEVNAYPIIPPMIKVLGEEIRAERIRPVGEVYFNYAVLSLASLRKQIQLVSQDGEIFDNSRFDVSKYK